MAMAQRNNGPRVVRTREKALAHFGIPSASRVLRPLAAFTRIPLSAIRGFLRPIVGLLYLLGNPLATGQA